MGFYRTDVINVDDRNVPQIFCVDNEHVCYETHVMHVLLNLLRNRKKSSLAAISMHKITTNIQTKNNAVFYRFENPCSMVQVELIVSHSHCVQTRLYVDGKNFLFSCERERPRVVMS